MLPFKVVSPLPAAQGYSCERHLQSGTWRITRTLPNLDGVSHMYRYSSIHAEGLNVLTAIGHKHSIA